MKKIMFSDRYGLTQAVLDGRKTMTRRICSFTLHEGNIRDELTEVFPERIYLDGDVWMFSYKGKEYRLPKENYPKYKVGEVVAIAQSYKSIVEHLAKKCYDVAKWMDDNHITKNMAGWLNKMFVRAGLMIFKIRITNVKVERLQAISDDECLREGIRKWTKDEELFKYDLSDGFEMFKWRDMPRTPREAFAALIDKVSGKGVWESNPWVFAYEFELVD